ncbi:hypothetical protein NECID01_0683 [Nematocida sp. AWRm77]|nr:hypothetical protein NECID01_0683 [Nematocida sp. AWRm77]
MKNTPLSSIHMVEGIQTANKNIYSYFMKNEHSYYVPAEHRYSAYRKEHDVTYIVVVAEYTPTGKNYSYMHNTAGVEITCLLGREGGVLRRKQVDLSQLGKSIEEVEREMPGTDKFMPEKTFIGLVYPDETNRVTLMNMINSVLNHSRFKGILVIPMGLGVSFGFGLSNLVLVSEVEQSVVCVEDNCVLSGVYLIKRNHTKSRPGEDVVEEFLKKEDVPTIETIENLCYICDSPFEITEFSVHFKNKHGIDVYTDPKEGDAMLRKCQVRVVQEECPETEEALPADVWAAAKESIAKLVPSERLKKIGSTLIYITEHRTASSPGSSPNISSAEDVTAKLETSTDAENEAENTVEVQDFVEKEKSEEQKTAESFMHEMGINTQVHHITKSERETIAWKGMHALTSIEPSKELWLTDKEWQSVGLRILKEKVLFSI